MAEVGFAPTSSLLVEYYIYVKAKYCLPFFEPHDLYVSDGAEMCVNCGYDKNCYLEKTRARDAQHAYMILEKTFKETKARNEKKEMMTLRKEIKAYHKMRHDRFLQSSSSTGFFAFPILFCPDSIMSHFMIDKDGHRECSDCSWSSDSSKQALKRVVGGKWVKGTYEGGKWTADAIV
jgi:Zn ribbon nucleic-acid-binding protein